MVTRQVSARGAGPLRAPPVAHGSAGQGRLAKRSSVCGPAASDAGVLEVPGLNQLIYLYIYTVYTYTYVYMYICICIE